MIHGSSPTVAETRWVNSAVADGLLGKVTLTFSGTVAIDTFTLYVKILGAWVVDSSHSQISGTVVEVNAGSNWSGIAATYPWRIVANAGSGIIQGQTGLLE
jgi:hypothetical protein